MKILPGVPYPLGADFRGEGTNFSLFSEVADRVELCLFDEHGKETRLDLGEVTGYCWHGYLPGVRPGQHYGYRVHGPWKPEEGHRCNPHKLLLDPYAKAICGRVQWDEAVFPYVFAQGADAINPTDSAPFMPRCVVHDPHFDWEGDRSPKLRWHEVIIYEMHVKGFSRLQAALPERLRGTYGGLANQVSIDYLKRLGVTAVELMPVHQFVHDKHLVDRGLRNYWGYNTIGYFAPHDEYACATSPAAVAAEFKGMVKALHAAGIAVIIDVVYNHTAEGNHFGPMLSFKGIDNRLYYKLEKDQRYYTDFTGCGNSLNMSSPYTLQLIMDSLRYWVTEMHVDGFRFDLASALARELQEVDKLSAFFDLIHQDPVVSQAYLIAEPWDLGAGGYQVGNFPPIWSEWNGHYRDSVRQFWRGEEQSVQEMASRFTGSSDLYEHTTRRPSASINFVTSHDGYTLRDLVSYEKRHNEANGENGNDGDKANGSCNYGVEGDTDDAAILALRGRQQRNFLTMLLLSQGVPMLLCGDECGRTQRGNNNAYCQDNEISWLDWKAFDPELSDFTSRLIALRKAHLVFRRRRWFHDFPDPTKREEEIIWYRPDGKRMEDRNWENDKETLLIIYLNGNTPLHESPFKEAVSDDSFFLIMNAHHDDIHVLLPGPHGIEHWSKVFDTAAGWCEKEEVHEKGTQVSVTARSCWLLRHGTRHKP
jgi:glycogen operon protein